MGLNKSTEGRPVGRPSRINRAALIFWGCYWGSVVAWILGFVVWVHAK